MIQLILTIAITIPLYLLPGYLVIRLLDVRGLERRDQFFFSLCISLVTVPTLFILVGNLIHFIPGLTSYLVLTVLLFALGLVLRRFNRRPVIEVPGFSSTPLVEQIVVWTYIFLYSAFANLSRVAMFVQDFHTLNVGTFDETWHLAELVSVARTGIPPAHYFFPTIQLVYYYAAWIYPAILGNMPIIQTSLARAMAIHAFIQIFSFLGLVYYLLRYNFKDWWVRLIGISFFTMMSGFGLYAAAGHLTMAQWWQGIVGWLVSDMQIHPFTFAYAWVPQHIAGGMAFLMGLLVWKNFEASPLTKSLVTAFLLAFCFTTSFFVFLAFGLIAIFAILLNLKTLFVHWKRSLGYMILMGVIFLLVAWYPILVSSSHEGGFVWRDFRINAVELVRGGSPGNAWLDRILTVIGFPLLASWIGIITFGLPFILYLIWLSRRLFSSQKTLRPVEVILMAVFPPLCFFIVFFVEDVGGGGNLSMRGLIPAQVLMNLAALFLLDEVRQSLVHPAWRRGLLLYVFACFLVAEGLTSYALVRWNAVDPIRSVLQVNLETHNVSDVQLGRGKDPLFYIRWLNTNTPSNALVIEDGCPVGDKDQYAFRWLERSRFMDPTCAVDMRWFPRDQDFIASSEWRALVSQAKSYPNVLAFYEATENQKTSRPVYYVNRSDGLTAGLGNPVYTDIFVQIYRIQ